MNGNGTILSVRNLRTHFFTIQGLVRAVDGVSFAIGKKQTFALVGESGCGKSVTALSIMRLVPDPPGRIVDGEVLLEGKPLTHLSEHQMREIRGGRIAMVFQEPMTSLNPVFTIGSQILEAIYLHQKLSRREARELAINMLGQVGIPSPAQRLKEYPHQLSGGMRQRVMLAMALSCNPELLIADEPTTALDVTIQAQILDLLNRIKAERALSVLLITHDLAVVAETADVVGVMYASKLVEIGDVETMFSSPLHPYMQGLLRSIPRLGTKQKRLETIAGNVPDPLNFPTGCKFHPRCPIGKDLERCRTQEPELREVAPMHWVACWQCKGYDDAEPTDPSARPIPYRRTR